MIFQKLAREYAHFKSHPKNMRMLLLTNLTYGLALPVVELFVGAYIIRNSADFVLVMVFQLAQGTGIPLTFLINGLLMRRIPIARLYALGMILCGISTFVMMFVKNPNFLSVALTGLMMGFSYGFFWSSRTFLALSTTKDENRNYYYGLETFFYTLSFIVVPFTAGIFIAFSHEINLFGSDRNASYRVIAAGVFLLTLIASILILKGRYRNPKRTPFLFFKFHRLWRKMLGMAVLKGLAQGYIIAAPVMLVLKLVGKEGALGSMQSVGALLSALLLYRLGKKTAARHRLAIFAAGLTLFAMGASVNGIFFSAAGVFIFMACLTFARPLMDLAYFPIQLGVIEFVAKREKRNEFTYIFSHELGLYVGRVFGCGLFIFLDLYVGENAALRYALPVIAGLQLLSIFVSKSIITDRAWHEPMHEGQAYDLLKEPVEL